MSKIPEVSIHLIVYNGEKYIQKCLEHVKAQTYSNIKVRVFNNASTDDTIKIVNKVYPEAQIINFEKNYVLGGGFNRSLYYTKSEYVVGLSVDVLMAEDFVQKAVEAMQSKPSAGVLQAKILRWNFQENKKTNIIDTVGMQIFKSRRVINRGHGDIDKGQYDKVEEIFCYEGAVPFFRREALEDVKFKKFKPFYAKYEDVADLARYPYEYLDEDFVWYADEVDLGWKMRLLGWNSWYAPNVIAWHDRQTTQALSQGYKHFIKQRKSLPAFKRKLDLRNQRLAFIKNDFCVNILRDLPWFLKRELFLFLYIVIWERTSFSAYFEILKYMPKMLKKRRLIMKSKKISAKEIRGWFK